jgi:Integrase core domain
VAELQTQLDAFTAYYNDVRPHRGLARHTPTEAFAARTRAGPKLAPIAPEGHHRVRRDRIDKTGCVTLRYRTRLFHIGIGRAHAGTGYFYWSTASTSGSSTRTTASCSVTSP